MILMAHFGYTEDGWSDADYFAKVAEENFDAVKRLERRTMGIGWPLKAIFGFIMLIPYPFVVYFGSAMISKYQRKRGPKKANLDLK